MRLLDGQHRLSAIARQSQSLPVLIQVRHLEDRAVTQARTDTHRVVGG